MNRITKFEWLQIGIWTGLFAGRFSLVASVVYFAFMVPAVWAIHRVIDPIFEARRLGGDDR